MSVTVRRYEHSSDYESVNRFLIETMSGPTMGYERGSASNT
jgi:hypothetical protein